MNYNNLQNAADFFWEKVGDIMRFKRKKKDGLEKRFLQAAEYRNLQDINYCIDEGVDINCANIADGYTALHLAAEREDMPLAVRLLKCRGLKIDPRSHLDTTPLYAACSRQKVKMVKWLLKNGADANAESRFGKTPVHIAVLRDNIPTAQLLFKYKGNSNAVDSLGKTPLHVAILDKCSLPMAKLLIRNGANPNFDVGNLPLFLECVLGCHNEREMELTLFVLKCGVDINVTDAISDRNALHLVALSGYLPLAITLLEMGCDPYKTDHYKKTPLDIAKTHYNEGVKALLENYMSPATVPM